MFGGVLLGLAATRQVIAPSGLDLSAPKTDVGARM
jgi:hypothetical protein